MNMILVLSFGGSLRKWRDEGIITRELEVYAEHLRLGHFDYVYVFTYGIDEENVLKSLNYDARLEERFVFISPKNKKRSVLNNILHSIDIKSISEAVSTGGAVVKTNQVSGCWVAWIAKAKGAAFLFRSGYLLSRRYAMEGQRIRERIARLLENYSVAIADAVSVTTFTALDELVARNKRVRRVTEKCFVAPTYVDLERFRGATPLKKNTKRLLYVGRLEEQKNIIAMVDAAALANVPLTVIGNGKLAGALRERADKNGVDVQHHAFMMNEEIAILMQNTLYFILPSLHEGLPKVLIEAMASEMICIGTPAEGILDLLRDGTTGYVAKSFSAEDIADTIKRAITDPVGCDVGRAARQHILANHSVTEYARREYMAVATKSKEKEM